MAEAQRYDAMKIAPNTYAAAIKAMEDAVSYIEKNVENFDGIQEQSAKFEFAAQRLMNVAREIKYLGDVGNGFRLCRWVLHGL